MKRSLTLSALVLALFAAPSWAAAPFGSFGGKVGGGNGAAGVVGLHGWALDDNGIQAVDILVDGVTAGRAFYGRSRPGVAQSFPGFPDSAAAGFAYQLNTTHFLNGRHRVQPRVLSKTGEVKLLNAKIFDFTNVTHNLTPFGKIEFPNPNAEMFGRCNVADPQRRFSVVSGYALDSGVQEDDHGVAWVELQIDRAVYANTATSCFFSTVTGGLTDCYGLRRLDIEQSFPSLRDGPHSGFRFVLDVGALIAFGYTPGHHTLTVRSGDLFGQVVNIAEMPVTFFCDDDIANEGSFGFIGIPQAGLTYSGVIQTNGWALDREGVQQIRVLVDGQQKGIATHGFTRPNVSSLYPGFPESAAPGWQFALDTTTLSNGEHFLQILVVDDAGEETLLGERRFKVGNV